MKRFALMLMIGCFLQTYPVRAEMYRYTDAGGAVRFTDNLAEVPKNQRAGMTVYETTPSPAASSATEQSSAGNTLSGQEIKMPEKPQTSDAAAVEFSQSDVLSNDPSRIDQLMKTKAALDQENAQLLKDSLALSEEKKTLSGNDAIKAYNEKVNALNARTDDYEKRRAAFQKEAEAFDAGLKMRLAPPQQPPQSSTP